MKQTLIVENVDKTNLERRRILKDYNERGTDGEE